MKLQILLISTLAVSIATGQPPNVSICYEAFSLPLAMAAKLQRQQLGDSELYKQLVATVEKETVRQELLVMVRGKSGQKSTTEGISEEIYPTEYQPAPLPESVGSEPPSPTTDSSKPAVPSKLPASRPERFPATPTAFDTRNVGTTLEIEPTLGEGLIVDLRIVPETVTFVGRESWGQGLSLAEMPVFEAQRINTAITSQLNQPFLLGTISRPPVSKVDKDSANRVWFAFVTATMAKP